MDKFEKDLVNIKNFLEKRNIPYYIHAGCGLFLHNINGELDDCDIRIYHQNLKGLLEEMKKEIKGKFKIVSNKKYSNGIYGDICISYSNFADFDICSKMVNISNLGEFIFPLELSHFQNAEIKKFNNLDLPVSSLENLLLYYLILRRGKNDKKKDEIHVRDILLHKDFKLKKFNKIIKNHPRKKEINKRLKEKIKSCKI